LTATEKTAESSPWNKRGLSPIIERGGRAPNEGLQTLAKRGSVIKKHGSVLIRKEGEE
jgi:hypothetical protein